MKKALELSKNGILGLMLYWYSKLESGVEKLGSLGLPQVIWARG